MAWPQEIESDLHSSPADPSRLPDAEPSWTRRPADSSAGRELQFRHLLGILRRRIRLISVIAGIGMTVATVAGLLVAPKYTAVAQIVVAPQQAGPNERSMTLATDQAIDTHVILLKSRNHLERVIESLSHDPLFQPSAAEEARLKAQEEPAKQKEEPKASALGSPAASGLPAVSETRTGAAGELGELAHRLRVWLGDLHRGGDTALPSFESFARSTWVNQERRSRVISVAFTSTNSEKAAAVANRIVQLYMKRQLNEQQEFTNGEITRIDERLGALKAEMARTKDAIEGAVEQRIGAASDSTRPAPIRDEELRELERRLATAAQVYSRLLQRKTELREQDANAAVGVSIHGLASVPTRPSSHNPLLFIVPAFLLCVIGASLFAVVLEQRDRSLRSEQDVSEVLGIACIGIIPRLPARGATDAWCRLLSQPHSAYAEAVKTVIAALALTSPRCPNQAVLISSSIAREGRTTLALSLVAYLARLGHRVLLVEIGVSPPGSSIGQEPSAATVPRTVTELGIEKIAMPRCPRDQFMLCDEMQHLIRGWRETYDRIIIDGPPLLEAAEARLLPAMVDKVIFVVKWGRTRREFAENAVHMLRQCGRDGAMEAGPPVAIVSQVDLKKHARYRYGDMGEILAKRHDVRERSKWTADRLSEADGKPSVAGGRAGQPFEPKGAESDARRITA